VDVFVDGRRDRTVIVRGQRLYALARFARPGEHELTLRFDDGVAGYAFTFG
jgi:Thioredoxin like C-terminal domain